ncbi:oleate hydratase [Oceanotoga teriensis]|uniref:Oleate hydratase n=1 Tax=Oceanotoga teriensis TaxID=515440 RepID=A0AA45C7W2_9BACT|nr:oleate hydratase [Oceanotoga teriensis]PWJ95686.1 oleate hydratase [Oceanotoga teriensis]
MYYSNGNYEAFARPEKPEGVDKKSAYLVGSGLASLSAAAFLIRDGQMKGSNIHILEESDISGGALDGINDPQKGFISRGGREMDNHFECLWDLFRSIPSIETEGISVLDEYYWLNKHDPNYSLMRATENRGEDAHTDGKFELSEKASMEIMKVFFMREEDLYDKRINDVFSEEFFSSNFWLYWSTMFAFQKWSSALEMQRYIKRFVHHVGGLPDFKALRFTKYNQYESLVLPLMEYLKSYGVDFQYNVAVTNVIFDIDKDKKVAKKIICTRDGRDDEISLTEDDLVFVTNGSIVDNSTLGDDDHVPEINYSEGNSWKVWKNIAAQDSVFGRPEKFCNSIEETNWESATVTTLDKRIPEYIEKISKRDPFSGKVVTGGIVTIKDSNWLMSWTVNRQPHFKSQPDDQIVVWVYSLLTDVPGNYIKKSMKDCTGKEIVQEWLYHLGVPEDQIEEMSETGAHCIPCMMPYITAHFAPRAEGDRPNVVPDGCTNFAFIGQFTETPRDTVFTIEYSTRTAMEAVYTLLNIDRGVPEVYGSKYDVRCLLDATSKMRDGKKITDAGLSLEAKLAIKKIKGKIAGTVIEDLLKEYNLI